MAMTLADIRSKYPQYKDVPDQTLADKLYDKYYAHADRREFDARIGLNPYDNALEVAGKAAVGAPGQIMKGVSGVGEMLAEGEAGNQNAVYDKLGPKFKLADLPRGGVDTGNYARWATSKLRAEGVAAPTLADIEAFSQRPNIRESYAEYLRNLGPNSPEMTGDPNAPQYLGTSPTRVAKAELKGKLERQQYDKFIPKLDAAPGSAGELIGNVVGSIAQMAPGYAASIALRNPAPAVALAQVLTTGQSYAQARDAGVEPGRAAEYALQSGFAEAVGEALPLSIILKEGGGKLLPKLFKAGTSEALQEGVTQFIQSMLESGTINPDMTWEDVKKQVGTAMATGAVAGGVLTGAVSAVDALGRRKPTAEDVSAEVLKPAEAVIADEPIENQVALPAPDTLLALPSPEMFAPPPINRRQPQLPTDGVGNAEVVANGPIGVQYGRNGQLHMDGVIGADGRITSVGAERDEAEYLARVALQRSRQAETKELLQTARETISPLGTFSVAEIGGPAAQRVNQRRIQLGRSLDAPITIEEMASAKVPQAQIDAVIAARRPATSTDPLTALDITRAAEAKNIVGNDGNFAELAYRTTGTRDPMRMTQTQLRAFKAVLDTLPAHDKLITVPIADQPAYTEDQYGKALDAVRNAGRYTPKAIKDATGLKNSKDVVALRDAMVRRGQLVQRSPNDFRLYDVLGEERQTTPDDVPNGAFKDYVVRRIPVSKVRVRQNGKAVGVFGSASEARSKVSAIRASEKDARSEVAIEPAEETAWGVLENRYDEQGNLLGQVIVDSSRDEAAMRRAADQMSRPDTGPQYTQTTVEAPPKVDSEPVRRAPAPEAVAGRTDEILKRLNKLAAERKLPLLGVRVKLGRSLATPDGRPIEGMYLNRLIRLSMANITSDMTDDQIVDRLAQVMDHELIHALREAGVLGPETDGWKTIMRYARRAKRPDSSETYFEWARRNYTGERGYESPDSIEEEAIAEAFRHWAASRRNVPGKPGTVFSQLVEWFKRLFRSVPDDLFASIETGRMVEEALRPPGAEAPRAKATRAMQSAQQDVAAAQAAGDENAVRTYSRAFLRARAQAREDRYGRSGPKTVLGTTPSKTFETAPIMDRAAVAGIVDQFRQQNGVSRGRLMTYLPEDVGYLARVADAQQRAAHDPTNNAVAKAYRALIDETRAMWNALGGGVGAPTGFTTAKGSTYKINPDGTTTRNKAYRPEHGAAEQGPQPKADVTFYVTPEHADELGLFQTQGGPKKSVIFTPEGYAGVRYEGGQFERRTYQKAFTTPAVGLLPVETWKNGTRVHFGNAITSVTGGGNGPLQVTAWTENGAPYASPADMLNDVLAGRLKLRLSADMFGPGADNPGHPLNNVSGVKTVDGLDLTHNDLLRVVHDIYGHGQSGFRDDPRGQYNAYHEHARLLSPEAARALATETLAQGSWANYGPHLRRKDGTVPRVSDVDYLPPAQKEFAEQKAFLLSPDLIAADPGWALAEKAEAAQDPRFMVAYHGTPHKVDKFSSSKIGTGEGAQAFGYGLYFAGKKEIAEHYRKALSYKSTVKEFREALPDDADFDEVMELVGTGHFTPYQDRVLKALEADGWLGFDYPSQAISAAFSKNVANWDPSQELLDAVAGVGNLYKVDIPEDSELLDWDKNVSSQSSAVRAALTRVVKSLPRTRANPSAADMLASDFPVSAIYDAVAEALGSAPPAGSLMARVDPGKTVPNAQRASEALRAAGIPGHRYEDAGSRGPGKWVAAHPGDVSGTPPGKWPLVNVQNRSAAPQFFDSEAAADAEAKRLNDDRTYNYVIYDDSRVQILEENPKFSKFDENLPGGRLYGNPNRSPGGALSKPGTPSPVLTNPRPGNQYFGGELAEHQLQMARTGDRGAALVYLSPDDFLALTDGATNPEQDVYDASIDAGYKFAGYPSLVLDGYAGNVRAVQSDAAFSARALAGRSGPIPVVLYPRRAEGLGLITALEGPDGTRVAFPHEGFQEFDPSVRGPRYSVGSPEFQRWFGDSKVVDENGRPLVVYHGTLSGDFNIFRTNSAREGGAHFGDAKQANARIDNLAPLLRPEEKPSRIIPVFLRIENPLRLNDEGYWTQSRLAMGALESGVLTNDEATEVFDGRNTAQEALRVKGYDGVVYSNGVEGDGGDSWIAFEPTQIKSAIANNGQYDIANPDIRYSLNAPIGERVPSDPPNGVFNILQQRTDGAVGRFINSLGRSKRSVLGLPSIFDARVKLQDKMLSIKEMIEDIKANGGSITDLNDTYMLEQLYHGKVFEQIREREETLQLPLLEALKAAHDGPNKITPKEFEDYLYARHAPERNAYLRTRGAVAENPSGMSDAEAGAILDRFALDGKMPEMMALEALARRITANTTATRIEGGLISPDTESPYQHYVPLRGFAEEDLDPDQPTENQTRARSGKGFSVGGREDRSMTGRTRKAGDLLGHLFLQNTEAVIRAEKNQVAMSFLRLLQENPQAGYGQILKTAPTRLVAGANGMIHAAGDPSYRQQPDIVTAKFKGQEIIARVVDPRLARAIKSDYVTTSNDLVNFITRWAGMLNRYLATINTAWNPEFLISNLARDAQTAGILSQQYDIPQLGRKILGNAPKAMAGIREVLRDGTAESDWARTFLEMQKAGGTTEFLGIHDLETQVRGIRRSVTQTGLNVTARKAFEYIGKVGKFVGDYNKVAENAFRLSAYRAARESGATIPQAAYLAKNLTVNFNKGGELKGFMNAMYLFYNASTQGTAVLLNGLKSKRVQKIVAGVVVMGVMQDLINRAISGDEDDNGVKDYDDIPDYILETNFVLMDPMGLLKSVGIDKGYIAIPMPYGFNAFYNLGRNMSAGFSGSPVRNPASSAVDSAMTFVSAFNPIGGVQSVWNFIAPTIADPAVDLITNKDFAGNDIVPERPSFGLPVPNSQKYWSNTGAIPKDTAALLNSMTGGNEVRPGAVDISPEQLQYAFDYAFGSMGKFLQRIGKLATETGPQALQGDFADIEIGDIPFARRVVGSIGSRGATERYYQVAQEVKYAAAEMKMAEEDGNIAMARQTIANHPVEVRLIDAFDDAKKSLQDLRKQLRDLRENENIPAPRKREIEKRLKEAQDRLMAQMTKLYFTQKGAEANRP